MFDESLDLVAAILDDSARVSASERPPEWKDLVEGALLAAPGTAPRPTAESLMAAFSTARAIVGKVSRGAAAAASVPLTVLAALVFGVPMVLVSWIL